MEFTQHHRALVLPVTTFTFLTFATTPRPPQRVLYVLQSVQDMYPFYCFFSYSALFFRFSHLQLPLGPISGVS
jgi:hypothetical protein